MISSFATYNWLTIVVLLLFIILTVIHKLNDVRLLKLISFVKIDEYFLDYNHRKISFVSFFNVLLFVFQLGVYALLALYISNFYNDVVLNFNYYTSIVFTLFLFLMIRYLIGSFIAIIFGITKVQNILSFVKFTYFTKVAIYIYPLLLILYYVTRYNESVLIFIMGFSILLLLFFYVKLLIQNQKIIFGNLFYFILYLCALEIIPLVYLVRLINTLG